MPRKAVFWSMLASVFLVLIASGCRPIQPTVPAIYATRGYETRTPALATAIPSGTTENGNPNRGTDRPVQPTQSPLLLEEGTIVFECRGEIGYETALCVLDSKGVRWLTSVRQRIVYGYLPRLSPNGQIIAFVSEQDDPVGQIYLMNLDGTGLRQLTNMPGGARGPAWSPDSDRLAFIGWTKAITVGYEPLSHIFIIRTDGSNLVDLTGTAGGVSEPDWSPDGQKIAFTGNKGVWVINVDGDIWMKIIPSRPRDYPDRDFYTPRWSPDGRRIALVSIRIDAMDRQLYLFNLENSQMARLTELDNGHIVCPSWAPDGKKIVFSSNGFIYRVDLESGSMSVLAKGGCPTWGP